jgi:hypothetical protein
MRWPSASPAHSCSTGANAGQPTNSPSPPAPGRADERSFHSVSLHGGSTSRAVGSSLARLSEAARVWL